jgi:MoaA/NifB/PqqE/SkfB family radical SAM enzyme
MKPESPIGTRLPAIARSPNAAVSDFWKSPWGRYSASKVGALSDLSGRNLRGTPMADGRKRCSWVHEGLTILPTGDVCACYHKLPGMVGNIYENTLEEIFNGERIREFRQQEIDGTLPCLKGCNIPQGEVLDDSVRHDYRTDMRRLQIEFGERCNIRCIMCPQDHKSTLELDPEILVRNVDIPPSCTNVHFFGGEPTILKSARKLFDHCIEQGTKITLITNGLAISEDMAAKIALHAKSISFSLNAASKEVHEIVNEGSKFEKVLKNIRRVIDAKKRLNGKAIVIGHMTIVAQNLHEIPQFIRKRGEFGFQVVHFGYDVRVKKTLARDPGQKARLMAEIQAAMDDLPPDERARFQLDRLESLGLVEPCTASREPVQRVYIERFRSDPNFRKQVLAQIAQNPQAFLTRLDAMKLSLESAERMDEQMARSLGDLRRQVEEMLPPIVESQFA